PYKTVTSGVLMFKSTDETTQPDVQGYLSNPETLNVLNRHGQDGWELVSVQQINRGCAAHLVGQTPTDLKRVSS
ncbi:hypothetical protein A221_10125, partial [Pseudomonas syringae pv. actinidiae ICMP 18801]